MKILSQKKSQRERETFFFSFFSSKSSPSGFSEARKIRSVYSFRVTII